MRIKNGSIALPGKDKFFLADIRIEKEKIVEIAPELTGVDDQFDAAGQMIFPGVIDAHVHFDDPGYIHREDFFHGTAAAASGGVTTVIDMPCTSIPPVTNLHYLKQKLKVVENKAIIDFGFFGGVSALSFDKALAGDLEELSHYILGVKTYFISGMDTFPRITSTQLEELLQYTGALNLIVLLHAEDFELIEKLSQKNQLVNATPLDFYKSRPEEAEIEAVKKAINAAEKSKSRLHIVHVSTGWAATLISQSQYVSGETAPHYLAFSLDDFQQRGSILKITPPLKKSENRNELWKALLNRDLAFVASDHAPAPESEKYTASIWTDYSGIPGSGTLLPFLFSEGLQKNKISLSRFTEITSSSAAKQYGIDHLKGGISVGKEADLVIVDPHKSWKVEGRKFFSKGKITPFEGFEFSGRIMRTMRRGQWVYGDKEGIMANPGSGKFLTKQTDTEL